MGQEKLTRWYPLWIHGRVMAGVAVPLAVILWIVGYPRVAAAIGATLPLSLLHGWLLEVSLRRRTVSTGRIVFRVLFRNTVVLAVLLVSALLGTDVMIGALVGISMEPLAYFVNGIWRSERKSAVRSACRGG